MLVGPVDLVDQQDGRAAGRGARRRAAAGGRPGSAGRTGRPRRAGRLRTRPAGSPAAAAGSSTRRRPRRCRCPRSTAAGSAGCRQRGGERLAAGSCPTPASPSSRIGWPSRTAQNSAVASPSSAQVAGPGRGAPAASPRPGRRPRADPSRLAPAVGHGSGYAGRVRPRSPQAAGAAEAVRRCRRGRGAADVSTAATVMPQTGSTARGRRRLERRRPARSGCADAPAPGDDLGQDRQRDLRRRSARRCPGRPGCAPGRRRAGPAASPASSVEHRAAAPAAGDQRRRTGRPRRARASSTVDLVPAVRGDDDARPRPPTRSAVDRRRPGSRHPRRRAPTSARGDRAVAVHQHQRRRHHRVEEDLQGAAGQARVVHGQRAVAGRPCSWPAPRRA